MKYHYPGFVFSPSKTFPNKNIFIIMFLLLCTYNLNATNYNTSSKINNLVLEKNKNFWASVEKPVILSFSEKFLEAGDNLIIYGLNFNTDPFINKVWIGGIEAAINGGSETELEVTVPYGAKLQAEVIVLNLDNQLMGSSLNTAIPYLSIIFPDGGLVTGQNFIESEILSLGFRAESVTISDLNADGLNDLIFTKDAEIGIAYRIADNSGFSDAEYIPTDRFYDKIVTADVNNDGLLDICSIDFFEDQLVIIYRESDNSGFSVQEQYSIVTRYTDIQVHDMNQDGLNDLIITGTNRFSILYRTSTNDGFEEPVSYNTGPYTVRLTIADFNQDNKLDVAVSQEERNDNLFIYLQNSGDNDFTLDARYSAGEYPTGILHADLNNDGFIDIITLNIDDNVLTILEGSNEGTFVVKDIIPTPEFPYLPNVADLDGNGIMDLALLSLTDETLSLFIGDGNFSFSEEIVETTGIDPRWLAVGDLNNDGRSDIAVNNTGEQYIGLHYYNNTQINITSVDPLQNSNNIEKEQAIKINFNANIDPLTVDESSIVIRGSLSGTKVQTDYIIEDSVIIIDPNALGEDFILGEKVSLTITDLISGVEGEILKSNGGTFYKVKTGLAPAEFVEGASISGGGGNEDFAIGDFNNDYFSDLVVLKSGRANIYLSGGDGTFVYQNQINLYDRPTDIIVKDFNNDGYNDIAVSDIDNANFIVSIFINDGAANFTEDFRIGLGSPREAIKINSEDLNSDGLLDIIVAFDDIPRINIYQGETDGSFTFWDDINTSTTYVEQVEIADINLDGKLDIIVAHGDTDNIEVFIQHNDNSFLSSQFIANESVTTSITGLSLIDLNNDQLPDLIYTDEIGKSLFAHLNNGNDTFGPRSPYLLTGPPTSLTTNDFNGDGFQDIIATIGIENKITLFLGKGDGTFQTPQDFSTGNNPIGILALPIDGDSDMDLLTLNGGGSATTILLNDATPEIILNQANISTTNVSRGSLDHIIYKFTANVAKGNTIFESISLTTNGNYLNTDIGANGFKLYHNTIDDFATATQISNVNSSTGNGETISFSTINTSFSIGSNNYLWITVDISPTAVTGNNIAINPTWFSNITFSNGNKTGTNPIAAGNTSTIVASGKPEPSNHATDFIATQSGTDVIDISWAEAVGGQLPDYYLLIGRRSGAAFPVITDLNPIPNDNDWSDGIITLNFIHDGSPKNILLTGLVESESYFFELYPYTNTGTDIDYKTDNVPTTAETISNNLIDQASGINFTTLNSSSITLNWINGTGTSRIVIASEGSSVEGEPEDFNTYSANPNFGDGDAVDINDYVVYNGTGNSVTVTGLNPSTQYTFKVFESYAPFGLDLYVKSGNFTNPASQFTLADEPTQQPENLSFTSITQSTTTLNYTAPTITPDGYIIVRSLSGTIPPTDGIDYNVGQTIESGAVIYKGANLTFNNIGLTPASSNQYEIYSYNGSGASINYLQANPLTGNITLPAIEPSVQANNILFTSLTSNSLKINWVNGNGTNRIVVMKANAPVDANPIDQTTYTPDSNFGIGDEIGTGNFVVYSGTGNNVLVNGLSPEINYSVKIFEFYGNIGTENYLTSTAFRNPFSRETLPILSSQTYISNSFPTGAPLLDGMFITSNTNPGDYLQDPLDELVWGHDGAITTSTNSLVQGSISNRLNRTWYVAKSDQFNSDGQLKVTFDLSDAGNSIMYDKRYNYFLVYSPDKVQNFSIVNYQGAYKIPSDDKIEFSLNASELPEGYYTLGRTDASPIAENALDFNGIDDYVEISDQVNLPGNLTLEAWVQLDDITGRHPIISKGLNDNDQSFLLMIDDGKILFDWGDNTAKIDGNRNIESNKWYHIAAVINNTNTTANIYLNGLKVAETTSASIHTDMNAPVYIGRTGSEYFNGKIDELRIWRKAKSEAEIRADSYQHINGNEIDLVAYYRFDQFNSLALPDLSQNNFSGVLQGSMNTANWVNSQAMVPPSITYNGGKDAGIVKQGKDNETIYKLSLTSTQTDAFLEGIKFPTSGNYDNTDIEDLKLYISDDDSLDISIDVLLDSIPAPTSGNFAEFNNLNTIPWLIEDSTYYLFVTVDIEDNATLGNSIGINAPTPTDINTNAGSIIADIVSNGGQYTIVSPYVVTNTGNRGKGTLHWAIKNSNRSNNETITFDIPSPGPWIISLDSALPAITTTTILDATSQANWSASNRITINGQNNINNGIIIQAPNVEVYGFTIVGFNTGIFIDGQDQDRFIIGDVGKGNIISNCATGIQVFGADDGYISGNRIGTNPEGSTSNPNTLYGIHLLGDITGGASNNLIGGNQPGKGNLISGNTEANIFIENSSNNFIERNVIGSNLLLNNKIGGKKGIWIDPLSMNNKIGGATTNERNIIGGNSEYGIFIEGNSNIVTKNIIGSDVTLNNDLGNELAGIYITGSNNEIGGDILEEGNILLFNENAITVDGASSDKNNLRLNSIYCNTSSILLLNNANNQITTPVINSAKATTITGNANPNYTIDIFTDNLDTCATGQGKVYLGTTTSDATGNWSFSGSFIGNHEITAQATDAADNSSSFSPPIVVDATSPNAPILISISDDTGNSTDGITSDATIILNGTAEANTTISVFIDEVLNGTTIAGNFGNFTYDLTASPFLDGTYSLTATSTDNAGNESPLSNIYQLIINTSTPSKPVIASITEDTDLPNDGITQDNTLIFSGTAEANLTIEVSLNNNVIGNTNSDEAGNWTFDYTGTQLTEGVYEVTIVAINNAGTSSPISDIFNFTYVITPVNQASNLNPTGIEANSATLNWTSGSGNGELLVVFDVDDPISIPTENFNYLANPNVVLAPTLGNGKVVYVGSTNNIEVEGLQPASQYKVVVFSYNDIGSYITYQTDTANNILFFETLDSEPTNNPTGLIFTEIQEDTLTFSFLPSLQNDDGYLVIRRQTTSELPIDGTNYTINEMLGNQLVSFIGPNVSFTQTGLQPLSTYIFDIYAYNGSGTNINYLQSPALTVEVNTPDFQPLDQAENLQLQAINSSTVQGNFSPAPSGADGYLVLYTDQNNNPLTIVDGSAYFEDETFDGWTVLQIGNITSFTAENLNINTNYTFTVMAFNGSGNTINYRFHDRLIGNVFTGNNAPVSINLDNRIITEVAPIGTLVGLLNTIDPDINDVHSYSLVNSATTTDSTAFRIIDNRIEVNKTLYYTNNEFFQIAVASNDGQGGVFTQNFTIRLQELPLVENDSLSVLTLYNDLNPTPVFSPNTPVKTWPGISVRGGKVTGLDLSSKGITNFSVPQVLNLDALDTLYLHDNNLTFQYLEPFAGVISNFSYLPQSSSNTTDTLIAYSNQTFSISIDENTINETYQWYKDGTAMQGENQSQVSLIIPTKANEGIYRCEINSTVITDLKLYSQFFYLKVVNVLNEQDSLSMLSILQDLNIEQAIFDVDNPASSWPGVVEENNRIVEINLSSAGLTGYINSSIGNLTELRRIDLFNNNLEGEIPEEMGDLVNLTYLDLDKNQLEGAIPESLGNLVNLTTLWLARNNFTSIPQSIGNLRELQYLFLQENNISNLPESLGELDKLIKLDISNNDLTAFINDPSGLSNLEELNLSNNKIESISNLFEALSKLKLLDLSNNRLKALPIDFNLLADLEQLFVYNNFLTFEDIEPLDLAGLAYQAYYAPQKKNNSSEDILLTTGTSYNLDFITGGSDNFYVWLKNGLSFDTTTTGILEIPNLSLKDTGTYSAKVYSNIVTDLEIFQKDLNVFVTCNSFPSVSLNTIYDTTVCDGKNIYIELTTDEVEGGVYNWRKDGQRLLLANSEKYIAFETGTYSLIVTDTNGCTAMSNKIGISTVPTPNVTINMVDSTTMIAQTDTDNGFYKWYLNGQIIEGANDSTLNVVESGVYKASVENNLSCEGFSEERSFLITSLNNEKISQEIKIYPNPVIDKLILESPVILDISKAEIYNVTGELIYSYNLELKQIQEIDIMDLAGGVYTVIIYTKNGKAAKRFVKI